MPHERRSYCRRVRAEGLASFSVRIGETNLLIQAEFGPEIKGTVPFTELVRRLAKEARAELHAWRKQNPEFFETLRIHVITGFLADPKYGGNRGWVGWKHLGYPGDPHSQGGYTPQQMLGKAPVRAVWEEDTGTLFTLL